MSKTVKLLLTENVDNLGIVGDVVSVRLGYARNFLLPRSLATTPSDEIIAALTEKRKEAEKQVAALRSQREELIKKIDGLEITMQRSANEQGILYGAVTQQEIAQALAALGYKVKPREVRIPQTIKRVDAHEISVKFDSDLEATIRLHVAADKKVVTEERDEMEFDNEGNLVDKKAPKRESWRDKLKDGDKDKTPRGGGGGGERRREDKPGRMDRAERARKEFEEATKPTKTGWGPKPKIGQDAEGGEGQ